MKFIYFIMGLYKLDRNVLSWAKSFQKTTVLRPISKIRQRFQIELYDTPNPHKIITSRKLYPWRSPASHRRAFQTLSSPSAAASSAASQESRRTTSAAGAGPGGPRQHSSSAAGPARSRRVRPPPATEGERGEAPPRLERNP